MSLLLSVIVGFLDGIGLAMFLPLLEMIDGEEVSSAEGMGNLGFIADGIAWLGFDLNIVVIMSVILFVFLIKGVFKFVENIYNVKVMHFFVKSIRLKCVSVLGDFSYKGFIKSDSGRIQNTLTGEVGRVVSAFTNYRSFLQNAITVLVYLVLAFVSNPQFAVFVAIGAMLSNLIFSAIYKRTKKLSGRITTLGHVYQGLVIQSVAFFKYLQATGSFDKYAHKMRKSINDIEQTNKKIGYISSVVSASREPIIMMVVIGVILLQIIVFEQKLGMLILSLLFFQRSLNYVMTLQTNWNSFLTFSGSIDNLNDFLVSLSSMKEIRGKGSVEKCDGNLELVNADFSYVPGDNILEKINLKIEAKKTIAFVGESGSGKTTLVNILAGLLPIDKGTMLIDGQVSSSLDLRTFQKRIGYITQEPVVFNDTIFNNITFWDERNPENLDRFWNALRRASLYEYVSDLPMKEESPLGNNGVMVSGGQKQRISIARELYKDIDVLIMDEATSALDSETERAIQDNIDSLKGEYTILIVAHRLSTIKNSDKIVLMKNGSIIDQGDFGYLSCNNAYFERMISLQELN